MEFFVKLEDSKLKRRNCEKPCYITESVVDNVDKERITSLLLSLLLIKVGSARMQDHSSNHGLRGGRQY